MTKRKLPQGVSLYRNGKYSSSIMVDRVRKHLGYFDTPEAASRKYQEAKRRKKDTAVLERAALGQEAIQRALGSLAFAHLLAWADSDGGGAIDTGPGSEFGIWCRAADAISVDLKVASDTFTLLKEVVFDDATDMQALENPDPFILALGDLDEAGVDLGVQLKDVNAVLYEASLARQRMTIEEVAAKVLGVADLV